MKVQYHSALETSDIFRNFTFEIGEAVVHAVKCIAHEGITNDEVFAVYEFRLKDGSYKFFGVIESDQPSQDDEALAYILNRTKAKSAKFIEKSEGNYLFELREPFGIRFSQ